LTAAGAYHSKRVSRRRVTRRSTWFGGEGKAKTQPGAPVRTGSARSQTTRGAFAPHRRGCSVDLGRQYSLAHQASARLNTLRQKAPPCLSLKARRGAKALAGWSHIGPLGPDNRLCRVETVPGKRW